MAEQVALADALREYRSAIEHLKGSIDSAGTAPLTAEDDDAAAGPGDLENSTDTYLAAGARVESVLFDQTGAEAVTASSALLAGDFRVLHELSSLAAMEQSDADTSVTAEEWPGTSPEFTGDFDAIVAGLEGAPPPGFELALVAGDGGPPERADAAIDAILKEGGAKIGDVTTAALWPSADQLTSAVGHLFGAQAGALAGKVLEKLNWIRRQVTRAVTKVLASIADRIRRLLGSKIGDDVGKKAKEWFDTLVENASLLKVVLNTDDLKAACRTALQGAADAESRAAAAEDLATAHAKSQAWVGWGATALAVAKATPVARIEPWGTVLLGAVAVGLVLLCGWLANDHLDAVAIPFDALDRVPGVRAVVVG